MLTSLVAILSLSTTSLAADQNDATPAQDSAQDTVGTPPATSADDAPAVADDGPGRMSGHRPSGAKGGGKGGADKAGASKMGTGKGGKDTVWSHIRPVGLLQLWGTAWDWDTDPVADSTGYGDPEDDVGFKIKRLRLGFAGRERGLDWTLVLGLTAPYDGFDDQDGSLEIVDAHVGYRAKGLGVEVGRGELPFSRDVMIASGEQTFTERGLIAEHIAPARDLGMTVWGQRWGAKVTLGAFNSGGTIFGDDNLGKTFVGRLEYAFGPADPYETWGGAKKFTFGVGAGGFLTDDVSTATKAVGADAIVRVAGLSVLVDAALADVSPTNTQIDVPGVWAQTTRRGLTAQVGYGLGAFEPAVKMSLYEDSSVGGFDNILMGVTWHGALDDDHRDRVRIGAGYELRLEDDAFANDTIRLWAQVRP